MGHASKKGEQHDLQVESSLREVHEDVPQKDLPNQGFRLGLWSLGVAVLLIALAAIPIFLLIVLIYSI